MILQKIIPTNFALDKKTFEEKLEKLKFSPKIHLDFMDGKFTQNKSISLDEMSKIKDMNNFFEIHLMAYNPEQYLHKILELNIRKVLIQEEIFKEKKNIKKTIDIFKTHDLELFIVLNPDTNINRIKSYLKYIDGIMIMSVWPGKQGQKFIENTYQKIQEIRDFVCEGYPLQIDGGINDKNIKKLIDASANILSIGSFISSNENPEKVFNKLKKMINN